MRHFAHSVDYADIGQRIKHLRQKHELSQEQLAESTNLSASHISHIENASTKISLPALIAIANFFQVSLDYLLCGSLKSNHDIYLDQIDALLATCADQELRLIFDMVNSLVSSLNDRPLLPSKHI